MHLLKPIKIIIKKRVYLALFYTFRHLFAVKWLYLALYSRIFLSKKGLYGGVLLII